MDKAWKQIVMAVILGILLPRLILSAALWLTGPRIPQTERPDDTGQTETQDPVPENGIPVLTREGTVTVMDLEEYVAGVVLAEMPASFEPEALKAQAVVARSYALRRFSERDRHPEGAVCTDPGCCQSFMTREEYLQERGNETEMEKVLRAVRQTAGQILTYAGEVIEATYFSCSGGRTEDAKAVWGTDVPYLQAVDSPGEEGAEAYWERNTYTAAEFAAALGRRLSGSPESWMGAVTYTEGGGVATMYIGGIGYGGTELRKLLDLNSTVFTVKVNGNTVTVETLGHGHRVGMSQYGADAMAVTGQDYRQILEHYYPGTRIDKWEPMG